MSILNNFRTTAQERRIALHDYDGFTLPDQRFSFEHIPATQNTKKLADAVRAKFVSRASRLAIAESIVDASNWGISYKDIKRLGSKEPSSIESLLIPMIQGGFSVVVNTIHAPGDDRAAALICHEVAHSFFYNQDACPPLRLSSTLPTASEEKFCDEFAQDITGIDLRVKT